ncbi:MAG: Zn-dependent dipeptidase-like protein [Rhodanobacteraceae bacterium]|nr:MAG: Zn-dependent dipeptidase-like protein [Rhodanobacteraceae bacterium]
MTQHLRIAACLLAALPCIALAAQPKDKNLSARVERVLTQTPVIDGHNDLPWEIRNEFGHVGNLDLGADTSNLRSKTGDKDVHLMTDIPRLRAGHLGAQFWSVYIPATVTGPEAVQMTLEQIDIVRTMVAKYPKDFELASTADDIERIEKAGRIASLIGVEGGHQINNSLPVLRDYYALGVRYMTLTHFKNTDWADSATDKPAHHGLTPFGRAVVHEMNRLGMLVDLSHVSPDTMKAALETTQAPVIFSHSSARALDDHPRDVPDDVLRMVKQNHGVVMVNFYPSFVSQAVATWNAERAGAAAKFDALYIGQPDRARAALDQWEKAHPQPRATLAQVADHIEHIRQIAGIESVGIGSDFDGIDVTPAGLDGVDKYPALFQELARRGWSDDDLADLAGRNLLRALREAEQVAARLQAQEAPSHATIGMDAADKGT